MSFEQVMMAITGPFGALAIMVVLFFIAYRFFEGRVVPLAITFMERHLGQIDKMLESHEKDRMVWQEGQHLISQRLDTHDEKLNNIENLLTRK